jgi:hypothetical protein
VVRGVVKRVISTNHHRAKTQGVTLAPRPTLPRRAKEIVNSVDVSTTTKHSDDFKWQAVALLPPLITSVRAAALPIRGAAVAARRDPRVPPSPRQERWHMRSRSGTRRATSGELPCSAAGSAGARVPLPGEERRRLSLRTGSGGVPLKPCRFPLMRFPSFLRGLVLVLTLFPHKETFSSFHLFSLH